LGEDVVGDRVLVRRDVLVLVCGCSAPNVGEGGVYTAMPFCRSVSIREHLYLTRKEQVLLGTALTCEFAGSIQWESSS
jgi:hypothetical protein